MLRRFGMADLLPHSPWARWPGEAENPELGLAARIALAELGEGGPWTRIPSDPRHSLPELGEGGPVISIHLCNPAA